MSQGYSNPENHVFKLSEIKIKIDEAEEHGEELRREHATRIQGYHFQIDACTAEMSKYQTCVEIAHYDIIKSEGADHDQESREGKEGGKGGRAEGGVGITEGGGSASRGDRGGEDGEGQGGASKSKAHG